VGDEVTNSIFQKGDFLDITGISKGKGFQGGMKRCGWSGGGESHGSMSHRAPGSIGASSYPSRVVKGHGMPGQMGGKQITVQNIEVVDVNAENNTIAVRGAVPGANGTYLIIRYAKKKPLAEREVVEEPEAEASEEQPAVEEKESTPEEKAPEVKEKTQEEAKASKKE
jgi:ribosomal protein L3